MSPGRPGWPQHSSPGRLAIAQAVPAGSRRARDQGGWLRAVLADPAIAELRADRRRTVLELARVLARHADWHTRTTWRPRERACAEIGSSRDPSRPLSVTAYKAARRVLEARGFLGLVVQGWTSALRAAALDDSSATSAVFVLAIPSRKRRLPPAEDDGTVNRPLAGFRRKPDIAPRAREAREKIKPGKDRAPRGLALLPRGSTSALGTIPRNRSEALAAARAMQERARLLRRVSAEHLRHLARPFFAAGWTAADVLHALDHEPGGRQHGYSAAVRSPAGWIRSRLTAWLGPGGTPVQSRSQRFAAARRQVLEEQASRRARAAATQSRVADYAAAAARAREMLMRRPRPGASGGPAVDQPGRPAAPLPQRPAALPLPRPPGTPSASR